MWDQQGSHRLRGADDVAAAADGGHQARLLDGRRRRKALRHEQAAVGNGDLPLAVRLYSQTGSYACSHAFPSNNAFQRRPAPCLTTLAI